MPHILAGFRIAVPYAIGGAIIAELISSNRGLGYLVQTGAMNFDTTSVFSAILAATLIVHGANWLVNDAERALLRWRPPTPSHGRHGELAPWRRRARRPLLEIKSLGKRFPARLGREPLAVGDPGPLVRGQARASS